jgi:succinate dehydrogenase / fumarate reductase cytochrome b subunit
MELVAANSDRWSGRNAFFAYYNSTIGKKYIMAFTGVGLFGFVLIHMLGNLQMFLGREAVNGYAHFIKSRPSLLWGSRLALLCIFVLHIVTAIQLVRRNRTARPNRYAEGKPFKASFASRTLIMSGLIILAFVVYHLMHFTFGTIDPSFLQLKDANNHHDVYTMTLLGFRRPAVSAFYIASMALLCLHLSHGVSSSFQSLGLKNRSTEVLIDRVSKFFAVVVFLGNSSMPLAVLAGIVR